MKIIVIILLMGLTAFSQSNLIYLAWYYPSNDLAQADASGFPTSFVVRGTNSLSQPWSVLSSMTWTNYPVGSFDGTNYMFKSPFQMSSPGVFFFTASASNALWGESIMSNTSSTPPIAVQLKLKLTAQ